MDMQLLAWNVGSGWILGNLCLASTKLSCLSEAKAERRHSAAKARSRMNRFRIEIHMPKELVPSLLHIGANKIDKLVIHNDSASSSTPCQLLLSVLGFSVADVRVMVPSIKKGGKYTIKDIALPLGSLDRIKIKELDNRDDGLPCRLQVMLDDEMCAEQEFLLLPPNAWAYGERPEALAGFVDKESRAVREIRESARKHLRRQLGVGAFEAAKGRSFAELGLSSESERTPRIVRSLYECLLESFQIHYEREPRTYPPSWQKIRFHNRVLSDREGTCIDLTLLILAFLEGIHSDPMLILIRTAPDLQHVLLGCWQEDSCSSTALITDHAQMETWLKPAAPGPPQLLLSDARGYTLEFGWTFSQACDEARSLWRQAGAKDFLWALDLVKARKKGVSPMPFGEGPHYSPEGWAVVEQIEDSAKEFRYDIIERSHLLLVLLRRPEELSNSLLGETASSLRTNIEKLLAVKSPGLDVDHPKRTKGTIDVLKRAEKLAEEQGAGLIGPVQLWHALLENCGQSTGGVLTGAGVNKDELVEKLIGIANDDPQRESYNTWKTSNQS